MINIQHIKQRSDVEFTLLILICRLNFGTAQQSEVEDFIQINQLDWDKLLKLCRYQHIRPMAFKLLTKLVGVPIPVKEQIRKLQFSLTISNLDLARETERIILLFKANGILLLPYKGSAFSKQFFGDLTSRESSDIDLVIDTKDVKKAIKLMEEDGYLGELLVYEYMQENYFGEHKDLCFNKFMENRRLFHVEFHWAIAESYLGMHPKLSNLIHHQGEELTLIKTPSRSIAPEEHFLSVIIGHLWRDSIKDLKALVDIGTGIQEQKQPLNWLVVKKNTEHLDLRKGFDLIINLMEEIFGVKNEAIQTTKYTQQLQQHFINHLVVGQHFGDLLSIRGMDFFRGQLLLRDHAKAKRSFVLAMLKNSFYPTYLDFKLIKLHKSLFFLYFFIKPFRYLYKRTDLEAYKKDLMPK